MDNHQPRHRNLPEVLPSALQDVLLINARTCAAIGNMGISWWLARVAAGEAPKPAIQQPRMTRWRLADVREYWAKLANDGKSSRASQSVPTANEGTL